MRVHHSVAKVDQPGLPVLRRIVDPVVPLLFGDVVHSSVHPFLLDPGVGLAPEGPIELAQAGLLPVLTELLREEDTDLLCNLLFLLFLSLDGNFLI